MTARAVEAASGAVPCASGPPDMKAAALEYAQRGWHVFPIQPGTKVPATRQGFKEATADPTRITDWWTSEPFANIGLALAASGLVAIDADTYKSDCDWRAIEAAKGMPETLTQTSARGGTHFIFSAEPNARYPGSLGVGVDVKHNGYILLAPSQFDGKAYRFDNEAPAALAPGWLQRAERTKTDTSTGSTAASVKIEEVKEALGYIDADMPYNEWLDVLMALHHEFGAYGLDLAEDWSASAPHRYQPGVVEEKFASFDDRDGEASVTIKTVFELARRKGADLAAIATNHRDVLRFFEPVDPASSSTTIFDLIASRDHDADQDATGRKGLSVMSFADAAASALEAGADPLIEGLLDIGAASVVYGNSNVGKTFVVLDMAHAIATGRPWAGMATTRAGVMYLALEGGGGIRKRFAALKQDHDGAPPDNFLLGSGSIDLCASAESAAEIVETARTVPGGCGLIVIDTMSRALNGGDENSAVDVGKFVANIDRIRTATGAHVLIVHHSGKDVSKGARGHSSLRAAVDTEIEVTAGTIKTAKQRDHDYAEDTNFDLEPVALGVDERGRPQRSAVVRLRKSDPATPGDVAELTRTEDEMLETVRQLSGGSGSAPGQFKPRDIADALQESGTPKSQDAVRKQLDALVTKGWLQKKRGGPDKGSYSLAAQSRFTKREAVEGRERAENVCHYGLSTSLSTSAGANAFPTPPADPNGTPFGMDIFG